MLLNRKEGKEGREKGKGRKKRKKGKTLKYVALAWGPGIYKTVRLLEAMRMMIRVTQWQNILYSPHGNKANNVPNEFVALGEEAGKQS